MPSDTNNTANTNSANSANSANHARKSLQGALLLRFSEGACQMLVTKYFP